MSPEGVKFRTSRLERHSPVRTGKQLGCNFCSYVVMTEQSTGGKRVQMKRRRKGGTATTKCSACHVHLCIHRSCWDQFHAGAVPARMRSNARTSATPSASLVSTASP